jgi:hypothetical protein
MDTCWMQATSGAERQALRILWQYEPPPTPISGTFRQSGQAVQKATAKRVAAHHQGEENFPCAVCQQRIAVCYRRKVGLRNAFRIDQSPPHEARLRDKRGNMKRQRRADDARLNHLFLLRIAVTEARKTRKTKVSMIKVGIMLVPKKMQRQAVRNCR